MGRETASSLHDRIEQLYNWGTLALRPIGWEARAEALSLKNRVFDLVYVRVGGQIYQQVEERLAELEL